MTMKLFMLGVVLLLVFAAAVAVFGTISYNYVKYDSDVISFDSMVKEEECKESEGEIVCTETLYVQEGNDKIPLMTSYVIKEKVFIPKYVEKEKVVIQERKLNGEEKESPADRIKDSDVNVFSNNVRIDIKNANSRKYIDSNSMDPLIDEGTTTIEVKPKYASEIKVGDIIAYDVAGYDYAFVHRVVQIGNDANGVYFVTKGDNYYKEDPNKLRFSDVIGIVVGILY
jgi:signal peptidase I